MRKRALFFMVVDPLWQELESVRFNRQEHPAAICQFAGFLLWRYLADLALGQGQLEVSLFRNGSDTRKRGKIGVPRVPICSERRILAPRIRASEAIYASMRR